jgi:uncharacterized Zn-binding protein involved in type VI secretion
MSGQAVARVRKDQAASLIATAASEKIDSTVFVNNFPIATEGAEMQGPPNKGDTIVTCLTTVFADNKKVAVEGSMTAQGHAVGKASPNVFAGLGS